MAGPLKVFTVGYSGGVSFSSAFTFPDGVQRAFLEIPTMTSATDFYMVGSTDGSTFRRIMDVPQTATAQVNTFTIGSNATNRIVNIHLFAPYIKMEPSTAPSGATSFKIICHY